jgi:hypothetical protein
MPSPWPQSSGYPVDEEEETGQIEGRKGDRIFELGNKHEHAADGQKRVDGEEFSDRHGFWGGATMLT